LLGILARHLREVEHVLVALHAVANAVISDHFIPVGTARRRDADVVEDRQLRARLRFVEQHRGEVALALFLLDLEFERGLSGLERVDVVAVAHRLSRRTIRLSGFGNRN